MNYGVCCNAKVRCSLSFESQKFPHLAKLLRGPIGTIQALDVQEITRLFQPTEKCSECQGPLLDVPQLGNLTYEEYGKLDRALRLRNQLLGLGILPNAAETAH